MQPNERSLASTIRSSAVFILRYLLFLCMLPVASLARDAKPVEDSAAVLSSSLYVKVILDTTIKPSDLKPGDVVEGTLARGVYSRNKELFPANTRVRLVVEKQAKRRRVPNDHWPWAIRAFTPRHENYPTFQSAQVLLPGGREVPLRVTLLSIRQESTVHAEPKKRDAQQHPEGSEPNAAGPGDSASPRQTSRPSTTANFEAVLQIESSADIGRQSPLSSAAMATIAAGTQAKIVLLGGVSASKSHTGDSFQARLVEPVYSGAAVVLPEGTLFEGKIAKSQGPRMLSRSGSVLLSFLSVTSPHGTAEPIVASVTGVSLDRRSHTRVDSEGRLKGDRPGKVWMLTNLGASGGIAKAADDGVQLLIEGIVTSATDVSTAGTARIVSTCASALFMATRHGRDVVLPKFTEMDIMFNRPVSLPPVPPVRVATEGSRERQPITDR